MKFKVFTIASHEYVMLYRYQLGLGRASKVAQMKKGISYFCSSDPENSIPNPLLRYCKPFFTFFSEEKSNKNFAWTDYNFLKWVLALLSSYATTIRLYNRIPIFCHRQLIETAERNIHVKGVRGGSTAAYRKACENMPRGWKILKLKCTNIQSNHWNSPKNWQF